MWKCKWLYKAGKKTFGGNLGHRLYGDTMPPENSIYSLQQGVSSQGMKGFSYWELDIVQSSDGVPFIFHDATKRKTIERMCPEAPDHLIDKSIYKIDFAWIRTLRLLDTNYSIPTLIEIIEEFKRQPIIKPIKFELKSHLSMGVVKIALNQIGELKKYYIEKGGPDVSIMMFKSKYKKVFNTKEKKQEFARILAYHQLEFKYI